MLRLTYSHEDARYVADLMVPDLLETVFGGFRHSVPSKKGVYLYGSTFSRRFRDEKRDAFTWTLVLSPTPFICGHGQPEPPENHLRNAGGHEAVSMKAIICHFCRSAKALFGNEKLIRMINLIFNDNPIKLHFEGRRI